MDSFEAAIYNNTQLNGAQKLSYLRAQLRGDAAQTIADLSLTSASYEYSVEVLKKHFGQRHILVSSHIQASVATGLGQSGYPGQTGHFSPGHAGRRVKLK